MKQFIVDAFTDKPFAGNPAAVCILERFPSEELMKNIARENNLSETAFAVKEGDAYHLRWFTPAREIDLCGHATLATAFVVLNFYEKCAAAVTFNTVSGALYVRKNGDLYEMEFPAYDIKPIPVTDEMTAALGVRPLEAFMGRDLLCVMDSAEFVKKYSPVTDKIISLPGTLLHITARGDAKADCVSRSFAPKIAINEDPVCGSGHCHIAPYWMQKLQKTEIVAYQASARGGTLYCKAKGKNLLISGKAVLFSEAEINESAF